MKRLGKRAALALVLISTHPAFAQSRYPDEWKTLPEANKLRPTEAAVFDPIISSIQSKVQTVAKGAEKAFKPYTVADLGSIPAEAANLFELLPNGKVRVKNPGGRILEMTKEEFVKQLNEQEKRVNKLGVTLRDQALAELDLQKIPTSVNELREQVLNEIGMKAPDLLNKIKDPIPEGRCPNIRLSDYPSRLKDVNLTLPDHTKIDMQSFLHRIDRTQSVLCSIGYSMMDDQLTAALKNIQNLAPGSPELNQLLQNVLSRRGEVLDRLGVSGLIKGLNLESFQKLGSFQDINKTLDAALDLANLSGPELIHKLKGELKIVEDAAKLIPAVPEIQLPGKPKRTPLNIKKIKRWDGLKVGKQDTIALDGFAQLVMGGSERDQTLRADLQSNIYVFNKDFNIVDGLGEIYVGPDKLKAHLHLSFLGKDVFTPIDEAGQLKWAKEDPKAFSYKAEVGYQQTFMVGPVPVAVRAGGFIDAGLGYRIGLINTRIMGSVVPNLFIGGFATGGVGIAGFLSGGAGAELTVVGFNAPLSGSAELLFDEKAYPFIRVGIDTDIDLRLLDGRVYAYAEYPTLFKVKKETMDIFKWKGPSYNHKIMSWHIDIGHRGAKMSGDLLDQNDRSEAADIQNAVRLDNRKEAIEGYRKKLKEFAEQVFQGINDDVKSSPYAEVAGLGKNIQTRREDLDRSIDNLSQKLRN